MRKIGQGTTVYISAAKGKRDNVLFATSKKRRAARQLQKWHEHASQRPVVEARLPAPGEQAIPPGALADCQAQDNLSASCQSSDSVEGRSPYWNRRRVGGANDSGRPSDCGGNSSIELKRAGSPAESPSFNQMPADRKKLIHLGQTMSPFSDRLGPGV